jgi:hypothetical protein
LNAAGGAGGVTKLGIAEGVRAAVLGLGALTTGFDAACCLVFAARLVGAELVRVGEAATLVPVEPPAADAGGGADTCGVAVPWCVCFFFAGAGVATTTFSAGAALGPEPIAGRCTVPESSSSAMAAAPSRSGNTGAATRLAITQIERALPRSSAATGPPPPSRMGLPRPHSRDTRNPTAHQPGRVADVRCFRPNLHGLAECQPRLDTAPVTPEVRYARSGDVSIAYQVIGEDAA